eukprot:6490207-Amphidinium_carterae.1
MAKAVTDSTAISLMAPSVAWPAQNNLCSGEKKPQKTITGHTKLLTGATLLPDDLIHGVRENTATLSQANW